MNLLNWPAHSVFVEGLSKTFKLWFIKLDASLCFCGRSKQNLQKPRTWAGKGRGMGLGVSSAMVAGAAKQTLKTTWAGKGREKGLGVSSAMVAGTAGEASVVNWIRAQMCLKVRFFSSMKGLIESSQMSLLHASRAKASTDNYILR